MTFKALACSGLIALSCLAPSAATAQETSAITPKAEEALPLPRFRHTDLGGKPATFAREGIVIAADEDFPPFSYAGADGVPKGIAVEAAEAACKELRTKCQIVLKPWQALADETADSGIVAGLKLDDKTLGRYQPTRPIYRTLGRFVTRTDSDLKEITREALEGKRIGVVAQTGYEAWLKKNFPDATIAPYASQGELSEALRTAKVDLLFGDGLQLVYWMRGDASQKCCQYLGGAYFDDALFSRPYVFLIRRGDEELKQAFDYALDQLQETGAYARIFNRYIPARFW